MRLVCPRTVSPYRRPYRRCVPAPSVARTVGVSPHRPRTVPSIDPGSTHALPPEGGTTSAFFRKTSGASGFSLPEQSSAKCPSGRCQCLGAGDDGATGMSPYYPLTGMSPYYPPRTIARTIIIRNRRPMRMVCTRSVSIAGMSEGWSMAASIPFKKLTAISAHLSLEYLVFPVMHRRHCCVPRSPFLCPSFSPRSPPRSPSLSRSVPAPSRIVLQYS